MKTSSMLVVAIAVLFPVNRADAVRYYYSADQVNVLGIAENEPPFPANFSEFFDSGNIIVTLDNNFPGPFGTAGLLTVEGALSPTAVDPQCSLQGAQCPSYFGDPARIYLEKLFSLTNNFSFDPATGAFTVDNGPIRNSYIEYQGESTLRFPLQQGSEPLHSDAALSLVGAFLFIPNTPGITNEELILRLELEFLGTTPPEPIAEPATILFLGGAGLLLTARRLSRWPL